MGQHHNILLSHGTHSDINTHRFCSNIVDNRTSAVRSLCHSPFWDMLHSSNGSLNNLTVPHPRTISNTNNVDTSISWQPWKIEIVPGLGIGGKKTLSKNTTTTTTTSSYNDRNSASLSGIPLRRGSIETNGFWKRSFIDSRLLLRLYTSNFEKVSSASYSYLYLLFCM